MGLKVTGPARCGMAALVLPVERTDGTPAALKMQLLDEESEGEPVALRVWGGDGVVRLLDHDAETNTLLLERLDENRHLSMLDDSREATRILAGLLARLSAVPAPAGLRRLGDIAWGMLDTVPDAVRKVADPAERALLKSCAAAVREVVGEPGDRLLHWDLHYDNILAAEREPWLAIDPKPLAGDPGFELMPALDNNFHPSRCATASTCSPRCWVSTGSGRWHGRWGGPCRTCCGISRTGRTSWIRCRSGSPGCCSRWGR